MKYIYLEYGGDLTVSDDPPTEQQIWDSETPDTLQILVADSVENLRTYEDYMESLPPEPMPTIILKSLIDSAQWAEDNARAIYEDANRLTQQYLRQCRDKNPDHVPGSICPCCGKMVTETVSLEAT